MNLLALLLIFLRKKIALRKLKTMKLDWEYISPDKYAFYEHYIVRLRSFLEDLFRLEEHELDEFLSDDGEFSNEMILIVSARGGAELEDGFDFCHADDFDQYQEVVFERELDPYCLTCGGWDRDSCYSNQDAPGGHAVEMRYRADLRFCHGCGRRLRHRGRNIPQGNYCSRDCEDMVKEATSPPCDCGNCIQCGESIEEGN